MSNIQWYITIILFSLFAEATAQGGYGRKKKDAFPPQPQYEAAHWYFSPGFTQNIWLSGDQSREQTNGDEDALNHKGGFGYYGEVGRYRILNNMYFFRYLNYGLALKSFKGAAGVIRTPANGNGTNDIVGQDAWNKHEVDLHFEMSNATKLSDKTFWQNSFGIVASYAFILNKSSSFYTANSAGLAQRLSGHLTYKTGFGYRMFENLIVIPSVQTSLFRLFPIDKLSPGLRPIEAHSMPLVVSIRFILLRKYRAPNCKPVDVIGLPEGFDPNNQTQ